METASLIPVYTVLGGILIGAVSRQRRENETAQLHETSSEATSVGRRMLHGCPPTPADAK